MITPMTAAWLFPILGSACALGFYDLCKKESVRDNAVMAVVFYATLCGTCLYVALTLGTGHFMEFIRCSGRDWGLILLKSVLVGTSWTCVYYAMRDLPISIAAPIRATAPLWTFFGSLFLFKEIPTAQQALGMLAIFVGYYAFSILGRREGISFRRHRGIHLILIGTLLGAASALYDKYLLGVVGIDRNTLQLWFSIDLIFLLGAALLVGEKYFRQPRFVWRWTIPATGILLIAADWLYFYALSQPEVHISILSLIRRCSCIVTFAAGSWYFRENNLKGKAFALAVILLGVALLATAK